MLLTVLLRELFFRIFSTYLDLKKSEKAFLLVGVLCDTENDDTLQSP